MWLYAEECFHFWIIGLLGNQGWVAAMRFFGLRLKRASFVSSCFPSQTSWPHIHHSSIHSMIPNPLSQSLDHWEIPNSVGCQSLIWPCYPSFTYYFSVVFSLPFPNSEIPNPESSFPLIHIFIHVGHTWVLWDTNVQEGGGQSSKTIIFPLVMGISVIPTQKLFVLNLAISRCLSLTAGVTMGYWLYLPQGQFTSQLKGGLKWQSQHLATDEL